MTVQQSIDKIIEETIDNMTYLFIYNIWPNIRPIIIGIIISSIIFFIIRKLSNYYFLITGSSKREARRKSKLLSEFIDWISSVFDIFKK